MLKHPSAGTVTLVTSGAYDPLQASLSSNGDTGNAMEEDNNLFPSCHSIPGLEALAEGALMIPLGQESSLHQVPSLPHPLHPIPLVCQVPLHTIIQLALPLVLIKNLKVLASAPLPRKLLLPRNEMTLLILCELAQLNLFRHTSR